MGYLYQTAGSPARAIRMTTTACAMLLTATEALCTVQTEPGTSNRAGEYSIERVNEDVSVKKLPDGNTQTNQLMETIFGLDNGAAVESLSLSRDALSGATLVTAMGAGGKLGVAQLLDIQEFPLPIPDSSPENRSPGDLVSTRLQRTSISGLLIGDHGGTYILVSPPKPPWSTGRKA